jgi:hypothetical protein
MLQSGKPNNIWGQETHRMWQIMPVVQTGGDPGRAASENDAWMLAGRIRAEQDGKLAQSFVVRDDRVESKI